MRYRDSFRHHTAAFSSSPPPHRRLPPLLIASPPHCHRAANSSSSSYRLTVVAPRRRIVIETTTRRLQLLVNCGINDAQPGRMLAKQANAELSILFAAVPHPDPRRPTVLQECVEGAAASNGASTASSSSHGHSGWPRSADLSGEFTLLWHRRSSSSSHRYLIVLSLPPPQSPSCNRFIVITIVIAPPSPTHCHCAAVMG